MVNNHQDLENNWVEGKKGVSFGSHGKGDSDATKWDREKKQMQDYMKKKMSSLWTC